MAAYTEYTPYSRVREAVHAPSGIRYTLTAEDYVLHGEDNCFEGTMFSFSYVRQPEDNPLRPVMFAFNGGPGASSGWVHLGFLGPKIVHLPVYPPVTVPAEAELIDNPNFLLDVCDIVLINPTGTTNTMYTKEGAAKYFNLRGDAESFVSLMLDWLKKHGREHAPVYILGESYGTLRAPVMADMLPESVNLAGILYIGVSFGFGSKNPSRMEPNVRRLCANAATCWYFFHREEMPQEKFLNEALDFAYGDYARALMMGYRLSERERRAVAEKLNRYTNLDADFLLSQNLRFSERDFLLKALPEHVVSCYDARVTLAKKEMTAEGGDEFDYRNEPFMAKCNGAIDQCIEAYFRDMELPQYPLPEMRELFGNWSFANYKDDTDELPAEIMKRRPQLKTMLINGRYDLQSTFDFVIYWLSQHQMPMDRTTVAFYDAGHAVYIGGLAAKVNEDIRNFILK